jgi:hypothetical protein
MIELYAFLKAGRFQDKGTDQTVEKSVNKSRLARRG